MKFYNKKKISVIVENAYLERVLELVEQAGASGYTVYEGIYGKGRHGKRDKLGSISQVAGNVEVVILCGPEVAGRLIEFLQKMIDRNIELVVHVTEVSVLRDSHFN